MSKNKLIIEMTIFTIFLFIAFGTIIINEKSKEFLLPKIDKKLNQYVQKEYKEIKNDFLIGETKYNMKNSSFEMIIQNKKNKDLYFIISYKNKKIKSSYKKDYLEGRTLLSQLEKDLKKKIVSNQYPNIDIKFTKTLNQYNHSLHDTILSNDDIHTLNIYDISVNVSSKNFHHNELVSTINNFYQYIEKKHYNPRYYHINITNSSNTEEKIEISNLSKKEIMDNTKEIINGIMTNDESIKDQFSIDYHYNNKEGL